jgi:ornithine cyclodeaminase
MNIPYIDEEFVSAALTPEIAFDAVESVFTAMDEGGARNFPVVREALPDGRIFGIKSGVDPRSGALGLKAGGYWPSNEARGLANHQSAILVFDFDTGVPRALVAANRLTALRTAAAAAISIRHLARQDSRTLGLIGAGRQMPFQLAAALATLSFERVLSWNRTPGRTVALRALAERAGASFEEAPLETVCGAADVLITITSSATPIIRGEWLRPGVHVAAMGTDTAGKQEMDAAAFARARVFTDEVAQAISIGECQHPVREGLLAVEDIVPIGRVIRGAAAGRPGAEAITIFDGTGVALQDLVLAAKLV